MNTRLVSLIVPALLCLCGIFLIIQWVRGDHGASREVEMRATEDDAPAVTSSVTPTAATPNGNASSAATATSPSTPQSTSTTTQVAELPGVWPQFRGPGRDNISPDSTPLTRDWTATPPKPLWSVDLGEGYAGAAVLKGRVYVLDYDQTAKADTLRCLSLANGQELWKVAYPVDIKRNHGMSRSVPAVTEKYVVTIGPKCHTLCTDALTGKVFWQHDLVQEYGATIPEWYASQCPLIDDNRVIIAPGGKALMVALDIASGKQLWQTANPHGWKMTHSSIIPMTIHGKKMYVYCADQGVIGVSASDGTLLWQTTDWRVSTATIPVPLPIGDGRIFITGGYNAGSIMLRVNGQGSKFAVETVFRLPAKTFSSDQQSPILYKDHIYGVISGGQMVCIDLNGKIRWTSGAGHRFGLGPYFIANGLLYVLNDTGTLTLLEAQPHGYTELTHAQILTGHDAWGPMALVGGRLLARDLTRMVCLDIAAR